MPTSGIGVVSRSYVVGNYYHLNSARRKIKETLVSNQDRDVVLIVRSLWSVKVMIVGRNNSNPLY
jgi:hypothetical protein